jgi:hypothetical protein
MNTKSHHSAGFVLALALSLVAIIGCSKFTLGPDAYSLATALDRVFEKQDSAQLTRATELIQEYLQDQRLSPAEAERLSALVARAQGDDWTGARAELRELLFDQTQWSL